MRIAVEGGASPLKVGDKVVLMDIGGTIHGAPVNLSSDGSGMQEGFLRYVFDIGFDNKKLMGTVTDAHVDVRAKVLSEGRVSGLAFLNQGSDLITGSGIKAAMASARGIDSGITVFEAGQGGRSRYDTGSHVDVDGVSLMTGLVWRKPFDSGSVFHAGVFLEAGWGSYDSYNSFANAESVHGNGDTSYLGAGGLFRYDSPGGVYADASVRAGQTRTSFSSTDLRNPSGQKAEYDTDSAYMGAHIGLGYVAHLSDRTTLDLSARYIWTRQGADSVKVLGDTVSFDPVNSRRLRGGARISFAASERVSPYFGAYYEHELDGKARAFDNGFAIDVPDLKGGTGVGELGMAVTPAAGSGLSLDLGVQGYAGIRQGITGRLQLKWEF
ncbi:MAG: autotransporter outer membrane beta-barrel domain-containing protein [Deltaproteobacteria bacterium]|nr:autotransporter outer membrane beta-barrel domain-containing protein [Deltaproteobacteria bacterium]